MPHLPATPGAMPAPPFLWGGSRTPLVPTPWLAVPQPGYRPWLGVLWRGWWGHPPRRPPLTFASLFLELEGVRGLLLDLMACSLVLWGCRSAVRGDPCPAAQPPHTDPPPLPRTFRMVLVQLVGSFLPVLNPVLQRVYQALHEGAAAGREKQRVWESARARGEPFPHPMPSQHPASPSSARDEPVQAVSPTPVGLEAKLILVLLTW